MQKTVKGKLAFDCPVVRLYFGFTPTFDIEPNSRHKAKTPKSLVLSRLSSVFHFVISVDNKKLFHRGYITYNLLSYGFKRLSKFEAETNVTPMVLKFNRNCRAFIKLAFKLDCAAVIGYGVFND